MLSAGQVKNVGHQMSNHENSENGSDGAVNQATEFHKGFQDVDSSRDSAALVNLMNRASSFEDVVRYRERMVELCPVDVGCYTRWNPDAISVGRSDVYYLFEGYS